MFKRVGAARLLAITGCGLLLCGLGGLAWSMRAFWLPRQVTPLLPIQAEAEPRLTFLPFIGAPATESSGVGETAEGESVSEAAVTIEPAHADDPFAEYLAASEKIALRIQPPEEVNHGRTIKIAVRLGESCEYGTRQACVSRHLDGRATLLTVHSGLGGEGEAFRSAVEGTGLDLAFYPVGKIQAHLSALEKAPVHLRAGDVARDDLVLAATVRIPPQDLAAYFSSTFDDALYKAADRSQSLRAVLESEKQLLIFEICGWQLPGEPAAPEVTPTTASIYLGVVSLP
jgi:hypothetical protein